MDLREDSGNGRTPEITETTIERTVQKNLI
jgi:hypothetical protein